MHADEFRYCPRCATALVRRPEKGRGPERPTCDDCGFIHYLDPKVAVGTIIRMPDDGIVLAKRAIEPGYGRWVFPGGYIDRGETLESGAIREALEECGLVIELDGILDVYSYSGETPVIVVFCARAVGGTPHASDDESLEVRTFSADTIPWGNLAFESTERALRSYFGERRLLTRTRTRT
jgi:ADP-ribose pyrophosphatase YjhB (NUDIX family)